jgi:hypothetical protein
MAGRRDAENPDPAAPLTSRDPIRERITVRSGCVTLPSRLGVAGLSTMSDCSADARVAGIAIRFNLVEAELVPLAHGEVHAARRARPDPCPIEERPTHRTI